MGFRKEGTCHGRSRVAALIVTALILAPCSGRLAFSAGPWASSVPTPKIASTARPSTVHELHKTRLQPSSGKWCIGGFGLVWFLRAACVAGATLGVTSRLHRARRQSKPDFDAGDLMQNDPVYKERIVAAEEVMVPTQGLVSHVTTITHQGLRCTTETGRKVIVDRMDDGKLHVRPDNGKWTTKNKVNVDELKTLQDVLQGEKEGYNLVANNCVQTKNRLKRKISRSERNKDLDNVRNSVGFAAGKSVLDDVADGKDVDANKATVRAAGAGAGTIVHQALENLTGSTPVGGTCGAAVANYVCGLGSGAKHEEAVNAAADASVNIAAKEIVHHTVLMSTKCAGTAGLAAEVVMDVPAAIDDLSRGKPGKAAARMFVSTHQAAFTVVLGSAGPAGWLGAMVLDSFVYSKFRQGLN